MKTSSFYEQKFIHNVGATRAVSRTAQGLLARSLRSYEKHLEYMDLPDNITILRMIRRSAVRMRAKQTLVQRIETAAQYRISRHHVETLRAAIDHALAA